MTIPNFQPVMEGLRSTLNHWVHHGGQLTVYMRLNEIMSLPFTGRRQTIEAIPLVKTDG